MNRGAIIATPRLTWCEISSIKMYEKFQNQTFELRNNYGGQE